MKRFALAGAVAVLTVTTAAWALPGTIGAPHREATDLVQVSHKGKGKGGKSHSGKDHRHHHHHAITSSSAKAPTGNIGTAIAIGVTATSCVPTTARRSAASRSARSGTAHRLKGLIA